MLALASLKLKLAFLELELQLLRLNQGFDPVDLNLNHLSEINQLVLVSNKGLARKGQFNCVLLGELDELRFELAKLGHGNSEWI